MNSKTYPPGVGALSSLPSTETDALVPPSTETDAVTVVPRYFSSDGDDDGNDDNQKDNRNNRKGKRVCVWGGR